MFKWRTGSDATDHKGNDTLAFYCLNIFFSSSPFSSSLSFSSSLYSFHSSASSCSSSLGWLYFLVDRVWVIYSCSYFFSVRTLNYSQQDDCIIFLSKNVSERCIKNGTYAFFFFFQINLWTLYNFFFLLLFWCSWRFYLFIYLFIHLFWLRVLCLLFL